MESSVESAMELALELALESSVESAMESAMATTGELRLAQPPPEVGWPVEHWDQVSGAGVCHVLVVGPPGPGIHLLLRGLPSDGRL